MKLILTSLLLFFFIKSFSQTDTIQRNAVFKSYDEFVNNTPSLKASSVFVYRENLKHTELRYTDSAGLLYAYSLPFWGFSDSEYVYIKYKGAYGRFIEIGKICVFRFFIIEIEQYTFPKPIFHSSEKKLLDRALNSTDREEKTFALNTETGEIIELNPSNMKKIITDDPDLLKQFNDEGNNKDGEILTYIRTYNQHHH